MAPDHLSPNTWSGAEKPRARTRRPSWTAHSAASPLPLERARGSACWKAAPRAIRLAAVRMRFVCASSTPSLTSGGRPKSSAVTTSALREPLGSLKGSLVRGLASLAQEAEELDALAQAALH